MPSDPFGISVDAYRNWWRIVSCLMTTLGLASIIQKDEPWFEEWVFDIGPGILLFKVMAVLGFYIERLDARSITNWIYLGNG